jgi:hypothetical protein
VLYNGQATTWFWKTMQEQFKTDVIMNALVLSYRRRNPLKSTLELLYHSFECTKKFILEAKD